MDNAPPIINDTQITVLLHSCFFGLEKAHGKLVGQSSKAILQPMVRQLPKILQIEGGVDLVEGGDLDENIEAFRTFLSNDDLFKDVRFERTGVNQVTFEIGECFLAKSKVHDILDSSMSTCPFGIIAATIVHYSTGANVAIGESEYTEMGARTILEIIR